MKKLISLHRTLLFVLFAQLFTLTMTAEEVIVNGIKYDVVKKTKRATVIANSSNKYSGDVVIPSSFTYDNVAYSVKSIGNYAFSGCSSLTSVTIPNSVTSIGNYAFILCSGIVSIDIPNSVTSIGSYAFYQCRGMTSITIPNSVTYIGDYAFSVCQGLISVAIPKSVTSIGDGTFSYCSGLTSMVIPNSVTFIGEEAFSDCSGLKSVTIGNSVSSILAKAFYKCSAIKEVLCLVEQIPFTVSNVFQNTYIASATLYVPETSVSEYKNTAPWSSFGSIVALDETTGIKDVEDSTINPSKTGIGVYDLSGYKTTNLQKGLNIVRKSDGKTKKVWVK